MTRMNTHTSMGRFLTSVHCSKAFKAATYNRRLDAGQTSPSMRPSIVGCCKNVVVVFPPTSRSKWSPRTACFDECTQSGKTKTVLLLGRRQPPQSTRNARQFVSLPAWWFFLVLLWNTMVSVGAHTHTQCLQLQMIKQTPSIRGCIPRRETVLSRRCSCV